MPASRPRILYCISHLALGGAERVAINIIHLLDTEFEFSVFAVRGLNDGATGAKLAEELQARGIALQCGLPIPMRFGGMITGAFGLARAIRRFQPDLIHLHSEIPEASYAVMVTLFPSLAKIRVVRTIHNSVIWAFSPKLGYWCDRKMAHASCIAVSEGAALAITQLRQASGARPLHAPPRVIFNAIQPASAPPPQRSGPRDSSPIKLLFGARFEDAKGADLLPKIIPLVQLPAGQTAQLTIFGSGKYRALLTALLQSPPVGWEIRLNDPIPQFRDELLQHDLLLMPSRFEGLPLLALEAALADLPIVATRAPGLIESLPAAHPWLAAINDPGNFAAVLSMALAAPNDWADVARHTRTFVEKKFTPEAMAHNHSELYGQLSKKTGRT